MRGMTVNLVEKELPSVRIFGTSLRFSLMHRDADREISQAHASWAEPVFVKFQSPGIESKRSIPPGYILQASGIDSFESISGLLRGLKIRIQRCRVNISRHLYLWRIYKCLNIKYIEIKNISSTEEPHILLEPVLSTEPVFVNILRNPRIDFKPKGTVRQPYLS